MHDSLHTALFALMHFIYRDKQGCDQQERKIPNRHSVRGDWSYPCRQKLVLLCVKSIVLVLVSYLCLLPDPVHAQFWPSLGGRILSRDGQWVAPVVGGLLSSDEDDHLRRGSVYAWDVSAPYGSFIFPMAAGTVSYAGCNNAGGYGCWTLIDHGDGYLSLYAHMIDEGGGTVRVRTGDRVHVWTPMGRVGWTGTTSFGPHVHWEIHHAERGRIRNDLYFSRSTITYCKFCAADASSAQQVISGNYYGPFLPSRELVAALLLLALGAITFFRPEFVAMGLQKTGTFFYRVFHQSQVVWQRAHQQRRVHWTTVLLAFLIPAFACSSGTALAVWMADEELDPRALWVYWRFGLFPFPGQGYQVGAQYSAVWGMPCHGVGTLGQSCQAQEIVEAAVDWQTAVARFSKGSPVPVAIPRLEGRFTIDEARALLNEMHYVDGLAIIDVGSDFKLAHTVVDQLTPYGLDGIAIDMEFLETVQRRDVYWLAEHMAQRRRLANLPGKGVLVLWNVFHNIDDGDIAGAHVAAAQTVGPQPTEAEVVTRTPVSEEPVPPLLARQTVTDEVTSRPTVADELVLDSTNNYFDEIRIIPIFTGYGPMDTKVAGLIKTQELFHVAPSESGLMAFDQRWPVNRRCKTFNTTLGFDCQDWRLLFSNPIAAGAGWWVQQ